jgi:hypothetical protein
MSAKETSAFLAQEYPTRANWRCVDADPPWDYECAPNGEFKARGFAVIVDGESVTNRTAP